MSSEGDQKTVAWRTAAGQHDAGLSEGLGPDRDERASDAYPNYSAPERRTKKRRRSLLPSKRIAATAKRFWIVLVVLLVIVVAAFCVHRLRGIFGAHDNRQTSSGMAEDIKPFNPKHVVYEVYGPPGTVADINYLDINAQPRRVDNVPLPWTLSVITTLPSVSVNVVAQGNSDQIGCRIIVNNVVKDERVTNELNAQTFCIVKSA